MNSNSLYLEQFNICVIPDGRVRVSQVDNTPHVGPKPHGSPRIWLIFPNQDRVLQTKWQKDDKFQIGNNAVIFKCKSKFPACGVCNHATFSKCFCVKNQFKQKREGVFCWMFSPKLGRFLMYALPVLAKVQPGSRVAKISKFPTRPSGPCRCRSFQLGVPRLGGAS